MFSHRYVLLLLLQTDCYELSSAILENKKKKRERERNLTNGINIYIISYRYISYLFSIGKNRGKLMIPLLIEREREKINRKIIQ